MRDLGDLHRSLDRIDVNDLQDDAATAHTMCAIVRRQIGGKTRESEPIASILKGCPRVGYLSLGTTFRGVWLKRYFE